MRIVLVALLLAAHAAWGAEAPAPEPAGPDAAPAAPAARAPEDVSPARPGDAGVFALRAGGTIAGTLVASGPDADVVELRSGQRLRLPPGSVVGRVGVLPPLHGDPRDPDPPDPARSRYVHAPSALALGAGDLAVVASAAALPAVEVGVSRWLVVSGAYTVPLLYGAPTAQRGWIARLGAHVDPLPWLHVLGGVEGLSGRGGTSAVLFGSITAGTSRAHATVYAGPPLPEAGRLGRFDAVVLAAAGTVQVTSYLGAVVEGWVTPRADRPEALGAFALRGFMRGFSIDAGWLQASSGTGVPWLAFAWTGTWRRP